MFFFKKLFLYLYIINFLSKTFAITIVYNFVFAPSVLACKNIGQLNLIFNVFLIKVFKGPQSRILHAKARSSARLLTSRRNAAIPPRSRVQCRYSFNPRARGNGCISTPHSLPSFAVPHAAVSM